MTEHRNIEEIKKDLNADAGSNVILNWKDAVYLSCYLDTLEKNNAELTQRVNEAESLLMQINNELAKVPEGGQ